ncbi:MAG: acetyl-CoA carboxylase biotin carboxylase subunit [Nitrospirae bacterium CG_4_10_14_0_8_um_filter_41_23]|nr:acetyl-CoA carboxylase biotin carboxylase subunit [Nitrospirota bacterium]OIP58710.1 MAG: acetyl-CoA carboxylase biotin carboxylase subunit [Nitrospirae bacterium CG2_30_41_42]PIQ94738.1 MAG: acetyl-CoA carboxylase biotin carboxylase subunit [Nitrospirae bacterium CG11_big_fil_rev_8_21_14_0_20_41_14]PIV44788.1 MAG: acetyl-CoA carboxylase biotin carboxylase subunit [Nitrospirae bacterium CG02_land_8_20_14_3_00_41_53]PIW87384.1 MAG: acetyl-CoA carboxylase biotin carboxylase subunit [Nitrospira
MKLFEKILIANRGEIAVRIIRACKELGIKTVAIYSDIDKESLHIRLADESVCIGPASVTQSYLNIPAILSAAEITDSDAIHPGYGFLSENYHFAEACITSGITFIGPTPENIRLGGDKAKARQIMKRKGVPVVPGSDGPVATEEVALKIAKKIGFPIVLKASAGGGGHGMKIVKEEKDLEQAFYMAQREALTAFGNSELYIEEYIPEMRHIEVQIIADGKGNVVHLGERDCSIQRRHQKLIEESPSPISSTEKFKKRIGELGVKAARAIKYRNVGTVEFIVDSKGNIYFIEINTRIQVEHPVTEAVTGIDIIKEQIKLAAGLPLEYKQSQIRSSGHAMECRINAEDPERFIPSPGKITFLSLPGGLGVRVDTAIYSGYTIPSHYDSLIAKLIVYGKDRTEAISRMRRALDEFIIEGINTTIPFHKKVMNHPEFISGDFNTSFAEKINGNVHENK